MADQDLPSGNAPDSAPPWEDEAPERDDLTADIFGEAVPVEAPPNETPPVGIAAETPAASPAPQPPRAEADHHDAHHDGAAEGSAYTVLARKYRPQSFEDMIGQEAMVRTLTNAFTTGRIAHGFMLTGVRGVGKTTTARLLARALNYETDTIHAPSVTGLAAQGKHCAAITEGRHIDVLELDAASRSGVNEMRELLDGVRYAPAEARYKVYVIDEVHMLSTAAFNALLKTLEEPPPHAKFIFATTEIRKVPVTILSRCQRFDLRRVEPDVLVGHLLNITEKEGARIERDALMLVARAAEGSVRDSLSLLDQAIVQGEAGQQVTAAAVRDMLGLADRGQTIALFEKTVRGEAGPAIEAFRSLYGYGADPTQVVSDLLEHCHGASVAKALGPDVLGLPKDQSQSLAALGAALSAGSLSRLWQMLLKAYDEVRRAPDPAAAVEMALIRLAYAAELPGPEEALKALKEGEVTGGPGNPRGGGFGPGAGGGGSVNARAALQTRPQAEAHHAPQTTLHNFEDMVRLIEERRDIGLKLDVERFMRPISFRMGAITFEPAPGAPANLAQRLIGRLKEWTGQPWLIAAEGSGGAETLLDREKRERAKTREEALAEPFIQSIMKAFPGAELVEIRQMAAPEGVTPADDEPNDDDDED